MSRQSRGRAMKLDRKSTRLNSSHLGISYAVFCLKKKKKNTKEGWLTSADGGRHPLSYRGRRSPIIRGLWTRNADSLSFFILSILLFFFFNDTATPEISTLSLHDALPIWPQITIFAKWQKHPPSRCEREKVGAWGLGSSAEQIQGVGRIVDVVDASVHIDQTEQGSSSRRVPAAVQQCLLNLLPIGRRFHQETIVSIDGQDISIRNGQAEGVVEAATLRNGRSSPGGSIAGQRNRDRRNAIVHTVSYVERRTARVQT